MAMTQENRFLTINTPLGDDVLLLTRVEGEERVSQLFNFKLDCVSEDWAIKPQDIVGKQVTFSIKKADDEPRYFNGFVKRFRGGRRDGRVRHYQAEVVPWLWFLTRTTDCKMFQDQTVPDILDAVFGDYSFAKYSTNKLTKSGPTAINDRTLEYCVQYRETDFAFISRLLEDQGVHYYFDHADGEHTLILGDAKSTYSSCDENEVEYVAEQQAVQGIDGVTEWFHDYDLRSTKWAYTDYDFKNSTNDLGGDSATLPDNNLPNRPGDLEFEYFDYPGNNLTVDESRQLAEIRMGEDEQDYNVVTGKSGCRTFGAGKKFKLKDSDLPAEDGKSFVLISVKHTAEEPASYETGTPETDLVYENEFSCIPDAIDYRPPRITPRPFVQGPQPAIVTGSGDVDPDEYGRVKVKFYWDREKNASCWIRVSQDWAGNNWGNMQIPWVGQEVIVDFYEGNPDRPIITGRVYNDKNMPPMNLPDNKYRSVIARDMYGNEIIFDHTKGDEHIRIHCPHHNTTLELGRSMTFTTKSDDRTVTVGDKKTALYGSKNDITMGTSVSFFGGASAALIGGIKSEAIVGGKYEALIGAGFKFTMGGSMEVSMAHSVKHSKGKSISTTDKGINQSTQKDITIDAGGFISMHGGNNDQSIGKLDDKALFFSYKSGHTVPAEEAVHWAKTGAAKTFYVAATASITAAVASYLAHCALGKSAAESYEPPANETTPEAVEVYKRYGADNHWLAVFGLLNVMGGQVGAASFHYGETSGKVIKPDKHTSPEGELKLSKTGVRLASNMGTGKEGAINIFASNGQIQMKHKETNAIALHPNGNVSVQSKSSKTIQLRANKVEVKGKIRHKNFTVD